MNVMLRAQRAYQQDAPSLRSDRGIEYEAFLRVTRKLKAVAGNRHTIKELAQALYENRQLWTALALDAAGDGNNLPKELRARIVYLAEFSRIHSSKALKKHATVDPLIDINTAVMQGLRKGGGET